MAIYDRVVEGTLYEWTICNDGRAESEEKKGKYITNQVNFSNTIFNCVFY